MPGYGKKGKMGGTRAKSRPARGGATRSTTRSTTRSSTRSAGGARGSVRAATSYSAKKKKR